MLMWRLKDLKKHPYIIPLYLVCLTSVSMMCGIAIKNLLYNPDVGIKKRPPGILPNEDHRDNVDKLWASIDLSEIKCHAPNYDDDDGNK